MYLTIHFFVFEFLFMPNINNNRPDIVKYQDPEGELSSRRLRLSIWYAQHRVFLYKLRVGVLAALGAALWIGSLWQWGMYLYTWPEYKKMSLESTRFLDYTVWHQHFAASSLQIIDARVLDGNKIDAVAEAINPNERFVARFTYYFTLGGQKTASQQAFLLPRQERPLAALGLDPLVYGGTPELTIENLSWRRISGRDIQDAAAWQAERLDFALTDLRFLPAGGADGADAAVVQFKLTNNSPYGYAEARFDVGLYQRGVLVALLPYAAGDFLSHETKQVDLRIFAAALTADEARVFPLIDIFDEAVYVK